MVFLCSVRGSLLGGCRTVLVGVGFSTVDGSVVSSRGGFDRAGVGGKVVTAGGEWMWLVGGSVGLVGLVRPKVRVWFAERDLP